MQKLYFVNPRGIVPTIEKFMIHGYEVGWRDFSINLYEILITIKTFKIVVFHT